MLQYNERRGETRFAVYFADAQNGIAVGGFSYTFETDNGGESWTQRSLVEDSYDDFHLNDVFADKKGNLFIPAEFGTVYKSRDQDKAGKLLKLDMTAPSGVVLGLIMEIFWSSACAAMCGAHPMRANAGRKVETGTDQSVSGGTIGRRPRCAGRSVGHGAGLAR